ncbi:MAG: response regulator [Desulfovibrionaceae bacterium]
MAHKKTQSIRFRVHVGLGLTLAIGLCAFALFWLVTTIQIESMVQRDMEQTAALTHGLMRRELDIRRESLRQLAGAHGLQSSLELELAGTASRFLADNAVTVGGAALWVLDGDGRFFAASSDEDAPLSLGITGDDAQLVEKDGGLFVLLRTPVRVQGRVLGHLLGRMPFPGQGLLDELAQGKGNGLAIWANGRLVAQSSWLAATNYAANGVERVSPKIVLDTGISETFIQQRVALPVATMGASIQGVLLRSLDDAEESFRGILLGFLGILLLSYLALGLISRHIHRHVVRPILDLARLADYIRGAKRLPPSVAQRDPSHHIEEVEVLNRSFLEMVTALDASRMQAEEAEKRFRTLYENAFEGIFQSTFDGYLLSANPSLAQLLGYDSPETLLAEGADVADSIWIDRERHNELRRLLESKGVVKDFELQCRRRDGSVFWGMISARAVPGDDGRPSHYEGALMDVTVRKESERAERERQAAEAASRAKTQFLATMSHEIRTPMNAIMGMADLLADSGLTAEQAEYVRIFRASGELLMRVINDVLDFSKIEAGQITLESIPFSLADELESISSLLGFRAHEKGLELIFDVMSDVPGMLIGDPTRLRQVLMNLVSNAIKFTEKGEVVLEVRPGPDARRPGAIWFCVRDTGVGIPDDKLDDVFESFSQADESTSRTHGGTGLGLAISKKLVEIMGGRIWAYSRARRGSSFFFTAQFGIAPESRDIAEPDTEGILVGKKILLVDDNPTTRRVMRGMLRYWGVEVEEAGEGGAAIAAMRRAAAAKAPFHVVVFDCMMPVMDGFDAAKRIDDIQPRPRLVFQCTSRECMLHRAQEGGLQHMVFLAKPVNYSSLLAAMRAALVGEPMERSVPRVDLPRLAATPQPAAQSNLPPVRILLADDNEANRKVVELYLRKHAVQIDEAKNGAEAVALFKAERYNLVLMDIQMPVMDGYAATRTIREFEATEGRTPTPVVALTAHAFVEQQHAVVEAGCTEFLAKPVRRDDLVRMLKRYCPIVRAVSGEVASGSGGNPRQGAQVLFAGGEDGCVVEAAAELEEIMPSFFESMSVDIRQLRTALAVGDRTSVERLGHSIKGAAQTYGFAFVAEAGLHVERAGRAGELSGLGHLLDTLEAYLATVEVRYIR